MRKRMLKIAMLTCSVLMMSMPVCAKNNEDTLLPHHIISKSTPANTDMRMKEDDSYHYIWNQSNFTLAVRSMNQQGTVNYTNDGVAYVPNGEYFISNWVYEANAIMCKLNIRAKDVGGYLEGWWSPDSVGSYPVVNPAY